MVPPFILMAPLFVMLANYGMTDRLSVVYPIRNHGNCLQARSCQSFFDRIPVSLEEAAVIDGCNTFAGALQSGISANEARTCSDFQFRLREYLG